MNLDFLYYFPKDDNLDWGIPPTAEYSVQRLIDDLPDCWRQEKGRSAAGEKKTLVLTDFACRAYWVNHELEPYIQGLYDLLDKGFTIYAWQKNGPTLLEKSSLRNRLEDYLFTLQLQSADPAAVVEAMKELDVASDRLAILDYIVCRRLFFHEQQPRLESRTLLGEKHDFQKVIDQLGRLSLHELTLVRTCSGYETDNLNALLQRFSCLSVAKEELKQLKFNRNFSSEAFFENEWSKNLQGVSDLCVWNDATFSLQMLRALAIRSPHIRSLELSWCTILASPQASLGDIDLSHVEYLTLYQTPMSAELLTDLIARLPKLVSLNINQCKITGELDLSHLPLQNLKNLEINGSLTEAEVRTVLAAAPNLQKINMGKVSKKGSGPVDAECEKRVSLHALEELELYSSTLLDYILPKACNLVQLSIDDCLEPEWDDKIRLPKLKRLMVHGCKKADYLLKLIGTASTLEYIRLGEVNDSKQVEVESIASLERLQEVVMDSCALHITFFEALLTSGANIREITCNRVGFEHHMQEREGFFKNLRLSALHELKITYCAIPAQYIEEILLVASNLTLLDVSSSRYPGGFDIKRSGNLPKLKKLNVERTEISLSGLLTILETTEALEHLTFAGCRKIDTFAAYRALRPPQLVDSFASFSAPRLRQLKTIDGWESTCTAQFLQYLLFLAPGLQELRITCVAAGYVKDAALSLPSLRTLLYRSYTKESTRLWQILHAAPNLEKIDINDCKNVVADTNTSRNLHLPKLKELSAARTAITADAFEELLQAANLPLESVDAKGCKVSGAINPAGAVRKLLDIEKVALPDKQPTKQTVPASSYRVDAVTGPSSTKHRVSRIFEGKEGDHPDVRLYRMNVYDACRFTKSTSLPFEWYNSSDIVLTPCKHPPLFTKTKQELDAAWDSSREVGHTFYLATYEMTGSGIWQKLPSWHREEVITHIYADGDILYSESQNLHYLNLRSKSSTVYYIIKLPHELPTTALEPKVQALIKKYSEEFTVEDLKIDDANPTPEHLLEAIISQQKGACRHRSVGFYHEIRRSIPELIVSGEGSGCHDFIFCRHNGRWIRCDLNGAPGDLTIDEKNHTNLSHRKIQISENAKERSIYDYIDKQIIRYGKKSLIEVHSQHELEQCKQYLWRSNLVTIDSASELEKAHIRPNSILAVNLSTFDAEEVAKLLTMQFGPSICFVGLYILKGSFVEETPEFLAYFDTKLELLPFETKQQKPAPSLQPPKPSKAVEEPKKVAAPPPAPKAVSPRIALQPLLERKVLETMWDTAGETVESFALTFDENRLPANMPALTKKLLLAGKNVHVGLHSEDELDLLSYWLQQNLTDCYYIDHPREIRCTSRWIDDAGMVQTVPGGPLFDYLQRVKQPILLINFNTFEVEDLILCNAIIDTEYREADGIRLGSNAVVIGLSVTRSDAYDGSDFTGRFYARLKLEPFYQPYPIEFNQAAGKKVDLYGQEDWKEPFSGRWVLKKDRCKRKRGELDKGNTHLEIVNGPWEKRDFRAFWLQESLKRPLALSKTTHIDWQQFEGHISWVNAVPQGEQPLILNPGHLGKMRTQYQITDTLLDTLPGLIKSNSGKELYAYLTSPLRDGQWYRLLALCKKEQVRLNLLAPEESSCPFSVTDTPVTLIAHAEIIIGSATRPCDKVIHVTDSDARLLYGIDAKIEDKRFHFFERSGAVQKYLDAGEHLVLTGRFSSALIDALMPLLIHGHKGKLTLITENAKGFELFDVKRQFEEKTPTKIVPLPAVTIDDTLHPIDKKRLQEVLQALNRDYHVCIEGETGVGKTTFIKEVLAKHCTLFYGMQALPEAVKCPGAILVIDEINAQKRQFNCLEGIYTGGIVDDKGTYHATQPDFRVVSCQNPKEYGGERREVEFLKNHPNTIPFTRLTCEYLASKYNLDGMLVDLLQKVPELTPRELEMMQLLPHAAHIIARCVLPQAKQQEFTDWFTRKYPQKRAEVAADLGDFVLTESRKEIYCLMRDLLSIRKKRLKGGLASLVLEGMPGDGKSHFTESVLQASGLKKVLPHEIGSVEFDAYCKIPARMDAEDKKACRLAAFRAGQVVLEEEANATARHEALGNAISMGHDEEMQSAARPGYFAVRTQNPISMKGRRPATKADQRRAITYPFPPYPQKEVYEILKKRFPELSVELLRLLTQKKMTLRELLNTVEKGLNAPKKILSPLPELEEQQGQTCKIYALSALLGSSAKELRSSAKKAGFTKVGEIYDPEYLVELAHRHGFRSTKVIEAEEGSYIEQMKKYIDKGHAPIVFFDVNPDTGQPILAKSQNEHAAVCVGYFHSLQGECYFTLLHWAKPWVVSAKELAASADNLISNRPPETFYKVDGSWRALGDRHDRHHQDLNHAIQTRSFTKEATATPTNATFRNKIIVVA